MDDAARERERRLRAGGSPEDDAAWLRARMRQGLLTPEQLELAALCGRRGAVLLGGHDCQDERVCLRCYQVVQVLTLLRDRGGPAAELRGWIAAARVHLARWDGLLAREGWEALCRDLVRVRRADRHPPGTWDALRPALAGALALAEHRALGLEHATDARLEAARDELWQCTPAGFDVQVVRMALDVALDPDRPWRWDLLEESRVPRAELLAAIGDEVAAWAVGLDPLRPPPREPPAPPGRFARRFRP
ncbi:MAG: hypothetical protein KF878_28325 [Planctomycetes bacterium]|nr:hypothetical protein [Planctomycetota bacterium]